jgi:transposase
LYVGLDLSRKRLDFDARLSGGELFERGAVAPDADGLAGLVRRLGDAGVVLVIESMNGARFVHDRLELAGWEVRIADAVKAKGLAPLACKTDKIDAWVLAELARRDLVPEIWLPDPAVRAERERARFRLHLVRHRTALKNRVHAILIAHGIPNPSSDLFGAGGRRLLERLACRSPGGRQRPPACERELRRLGADHPYVSRLITCPGVASILAFTIASQIGDIARFRTPTKLTGYTGLTPKVEQSGDSDRRGPLRKNGPNHPRWALVDAAHTASRHPLYQPIVERNRARHGRTRGSKLAALTIGFERTLPKCRQDSCRCGRRVRGGDPAL